jgi:hypothetical protein
MSENEYSGSTESSKVIFNHEIPEEGKIDEFPSLNKIPEIPEIPVIGPEIPMEQTEIPKIKNPEEIDVKSVRPLEEIFPEESPEEGIAPEKKELTDEEKKEKFIQHLKDSKLVYHPRKNFGVAYHKKRKTKNKMQRQSRKNNR